jgi:hypothetical protein
MSEEIGLPDLIYQVKNELLAHRPIEKAKGLPALFWIDQLELELSVAATREKGGRIKLSVLPVGGEVGQSHTEERGHTVKVRLTPLLSREEMRQLLYNDPSFREALAHFSTIGLARETEQQSR